MPEARLQKTRNSYSHSNAKHVWPPNDVRQHIFSSGCWCQPMTNVVGDTTIIVHNSADGRELVEEHGVQ